MPQTATRAPKAIRGRPVFGHDRLPAEQAEACPAWPSLSRVEGQRQAAFTRFIRPKPAQVGGYDHRESPEAVFMRFIRGASGDLRKAKAGNLPGWTIKPHEHHTEDATAAVVRCYDCKAQINV